MLSDHDRNKTRAANSIKAKGVIQKIDDTKIPTYNNSRVDNDSSKINSNADDIKTPEDSDDGNTSINTKIIPYVLRYRIS